MAGATIGLLHPGEMGAALGHALRERGHDVLWASSGRSEATARRAAEADLRDVELVEAIARHSGVIFSVCPPHAAREVARSVAGTGAIFVDGNAIAPASARAISTELGSRFVDGGIIGPPPRRAGTTRLYLSGPGADAVAELFDETSVDARAISGTVGDASALKMTYAAWTKGTAALLLAIRTVANGPSFPQAAHELRIVKRKGGPFDRPWFLLWERNYFFSDLPSIVGPAPEPI